jgi:hypothetical protein
MVSVSFDSSVLGRVGVVGSAELLHCETLSHETLDFETTNFRA